MLSQGMGWQVPRLPGLGDVDWVKFLTALKSIGYDDAVSIEHEDRNYEGDEELVKKGFYISRDILMPLINRSNIRD
jgi:sugar phosphate isomerase/epimerase